MPSTSTVSSRIVAAAILCWLAIPSEAVGASYRGQAASQVTQFCGDRVCPTGGGFQQEAPTRQGKRAVARGGYDAQVIGGMSPECRPWRGLTCGCETSLKVFGRVVHSPYNLKQAREWGRFPRAACAPGMVAQNSRHVAYIEQCHGDGTATLWDPNSGYSGGRGDGLIRRHRVSLAPYHVVNPHGLSLAAVR